jgi:uncharacterized membrane protein
MSSPEFSSTPSRSGSWLLVLLLILGYVAALLAFPPRYEHADGEVSTLLLFFGRFHPILLHLPVGALALLCLMELGCLTRAGEEKLGAAALLTLLVGAAGSVFAVIAGILLSREGGYEGANFTLHQTLALIGTSGVLLAAIVRLRAMSRDNRELMHAYRALFFLSFGIMGLGAHFGGNMSHGSKFLTEHAPEPLKSQMIGMEKWMLRFAEKPKPTPTPAVAVTPVPAPATNPSPPTNPAPAPTPASQPPAAPGGAKPGASPLVFQDLLMPIFETKCNNCHNEDKSKGGLRMDTHALLVQGGDGGTALVPGKPDESLALQRILLPADDDEHMPPEGKEQMTPEETALFRWWIQAGASESLRLDDPKFPADLKASE